MKAYISSTYSDLREYREAARKVLLRMDVSVVGMEYFTATGFPPMEECLLAVRSADLYILIIGHRYGFIPTGHDTSITHLEYRAAVSSQKPILSFMLSDDVPVPVSSIEQDPNLRLQLELFKNEIRSAMVVSLVRSSDDLSVSLAGALVNFLRCELTQVVPDTALQKSLLACREESERYKRVIEDLSAKLKSTVPAQPIWRGRKFDTDQILCFALLPFKDEFFEVYESAVAPAAEELGLRASHAGEIFGNREIVEDIWEAICAARIIIVDVTGRNPNVFYELGICHTLGKECIIITRNKDDVPFDIRYRRFIEYSSDCLTKLRAILRKTIQAILSTGLSPDQPTI